MRPVRRNSCWAPPATTAFGRVGCAKSRVLTGVPGRLAARRTALRTTGAPDLRALEAGRSVLDAAALGALSFGGSASSRLTSAGSTFCGLGAAYRRETLASRAYV